MFSIGIMFYSSYDYIFSCADVDSTQKHPTPIITGMRLKVFLTQVAKTSKVILNGRVVLSTNVIFRMEQRVLRLGMALFLIDRLLVIQLLRG